MVASNFLFALQHLSSKSWKKKAETLRKLPSKRKRERHHNGETVGGGVIRQFQKGTLFGVKAINYCNGSKQSLSCCVRPFLEHHQPLSRGEPFIRPRGPHVTHHVLITLDWCRLPAHLVISSHSDVSTITIVGSAKTWVLYHWKVAVCLIC